MTQAKLERVSKFLSYVLRHEPASIGLTLDGQGWVDIDELTSKANSSDQGIPLTHALLQKVVFTNDKKRFTISKDGKKIRAAQGHSVNVDLQVKPVEPPEFLFHGTANRFLDRILAEGLNPQQRQYVHLSEDIETATAVGQRYGKPVILTIKALLVHEQGFMFYLSENRVWLTNFFPIKFMAEIKNV